MKELQKVPILPQAEGRDQSNIGLTKSAGEDKHGIVINDRRKDDVRSGSVCPALMARDFKDPKKVLIKEATKKGYAEAKVGDSINLEFPNSNTRRGRVGKGIVNTINTGCQIGTLDNNYRIRRLTPRECFRLQGFPDDYFDRARAVNSDSQLYKQAGNAVTVNVAFVVAGMINRSQIDTSTSE